MKLGFVSDAWVFYRVHAKGTLKNAPVQATKSLLEKAHSSPRVGA